MLEIVIENYNSVFSFGRHVNHLAAHRFSSTKKILMEHYSPKQNYSGQRHTWEPGLLSEQSTILDTKSQL